MTNRLRTSNPFPPGSVLAVLYVSVEELTTDDQICFSHQLQKDLQDDSLSSNTDPKRERRALAALMQAADASGEVVLTQQRYRVLRETLGKTSEWPDDRCVRRWLVAPSWNDALRRVRLDAVPDGDVILSWSNSAYSRDECVAAIHEFTSACSKHPESFRDYSAWAKRPEVKSLPGRRPSSQGTFDRHGGFTSVLTEAMGGEPSARRIVGSATIRAASHHISDAQLDDALNEVTARLGHAPSVAEYQRERIAISQVSMDAGYPRALPSHTTFRSRHPNLTWDEILTHYGLTRSAAQRAGAKSGPKGPTGPRVTAAHVVDSLIACYTRLGEPFTSGTYQDWRIGEREQAHAKGMNCEHAHLTTVYDRFAGWGQAVEAMHTEIKRRESDAA